MEKTQHPAQAAARKSIMEVFAEGARDGMRLVMTNMAPNVVFAFCIIIMLNITGLMPLIGSFFRPLMGVFGLPGEAATACALAPISISGGIAAVIALVQDGVMNPRHCAIIFPYLMLVGAMMQYHGRILAPSGVSPKGARICVTIAFIDGIAAMFLMRLILTLC